MKVRFVADRFSRLRCISTLGMVIACCLTMQAHDTVTRDVHVLQAAVQVVAQDNGLSLSEKRLLAYVPYVYVVALRNRHELDRISCAVTGQPFDWSNTGGALAQLREKISSFKECVLLYEQQHYIILEAALTELYNEFYLESITSTLDKTLQVSIALEKLDELQNLLAQVFEALVAAFDSFTSQVDTITSLIDVAVEIMTEAAVALTEATDAMNDAESTASSISNTITSIEDTAIAVDSKTDILLTLVAVDPTPIYHDGSNTIVISDAGAYCLVQSVMLLSGASAVPVISIQASNVTLDLNSFQVYSEVTDVGIEVTSGVSSVVIKNGTVCSNGTGTTGISVTNASDVVIEDVVVRNWSTSFYGVLLSGANNVVLDAVSAHNSGTGIGCLNSEEIVIQNSMCDTNAAAGCTISGSNNSIVSNLSCRANGATGLSVTTSSDTITIENCLSNNNTGSGYVISNATNIYLADVMSMVNIGTGIAIDNSTNIDCVGCVSSACTADGFSLDTVDDACINNCAALQNSVYGFNIGFTGGVCSNIAVNDSVATSNTGDGFAVGKLAFPSTNVLMQRCIAQANIGIGIEDANDTSNRYYSNAAYVNNPGGSPAKNYAGITNVLPTGSTASTYWTANVDGSLA